MNSKYNESASREINHTNAWTSGNHGSLLEPMCYPDPLLFKAGLEKISKDEQELKKNINRNKTTLLVLAPFLKIIQKDHKPSHQRQSDSKSKIHFDQKPLQFESIVPVTSVKSTIIKSIYESGETLKALLKASQVVLYSVNTVKQEICYCPQYEVSTTHQLKWKIEPYTTLAAHAAFTKQYVTSDQVQRDQRFSPENNLIDSPNLFSICIPIKTPDNHVVAVYEIMLDKSELIFNKRDLQLVLTVANWMGVAVLQNSLYSTLARQHELTDYLTQLTNHYHSNQSLVNHTLSDIVVFAREAIGAEQCSLYIVKKESNRALLVEEYNQGICNPQILFKKRSKKNVYRDQSVLSTVLFKKEVVNNNSFDRKLELDGIKSLLCVPILENNQIIGAIQLSNKRAASTFNKIDEETLLQFTKFCPMNINHLISHSKMKQCELQTKVMDEILNYHIKPCIHDQERTKNYAGDLPNDFFSFSWYPSPDQMPKLVELTINMFHEVLGNPFMALNNVPKFVLTVKNCYRPNPYHNYLHAFCVTHTMANIISLYRRYFTGIERKGLMIAALCHDVDHRGYTNNFIQLTKHYLSKLYDSSPLENHHYSVAKMIIQQCGMFSYIQPVIYNELMMEIYDCIIATDLSLYFQSRMELMKVADEKTFTFKNTHHRRLVKSLMMTACDLSGQTKPLPVCKKITADVYEEFYQQGDIEKNMGFVPLPTMDRDKRDMINDNQVQFLSVVVLPCVEAVNRIFSNLSPMVWDCKILLKQWKELAEKKK